MPGMSELDVNSWIQEQANALNVDVRTYDGGTKRQGNWLRVPVGIQMDGDAYDRASMLQKIEDAWDVDDHDGVHLTIVPARYS